MLVSAAITENVDVKSKSAKKREKKIDVQRLTYAERHIWT